MQAGSDRKTEADTEMGIEADTVRRVQRQAGRQ